MDTSAGLAPDRATVMPYRIVGSSGLKVSAIGLGCGALGTSLVDTAMTDAVVGAALDREITYFDTADVYGVGTSETLLGSALRGRRHRAVIGTKFGLNMGPGPNEYGGSRSRIVRACEESLRRLNTDYIDIYQFHAPDPATPIEQTLRALDDLVRQGKVRHLGCSNFRAWQLCEAEWTARKAGLNRFVLTQDFHNLLYRGCEAEMEPLCAAYRIGRTAYFPLAAGLLTDSYRRGEQAPPNSRGARSTFPTWQTDRNWRQQEQLREIARDLGISLAQLSVAWLLTRPMMFTVIAGADTPEHVATNAAAAAIELDAATLRRIDEATLRPDDDRSVPPLYATQPLVRWPR